MSTAITGKLCDVETNNGNRFLGINSDLVPIEAFRLVGQPVVIVSEDEWQLIQGEHKDLQKCENELRAHEAKLARVKKLPSVIMRAILADVTDRRGWKQEWGMFAPEVQKEIRAEWTRIIQKHLTRVLADSGAEKQEGAR